MTARFFWLCAQPMLRLVICRVQLKTEMDKAVFQVKVSLNIRKYSAAEALPPSHGNGEGSSNKQLELPHQRPSSRQLVLDSRFTH